MSWYSDKEKFDEWDWDEGDLDWDLSVRPHCELFTLEEVTDVYTTTTNKDVKLKLADAINTEPYAVGTMAWYDMGTTPNGYDEVYLVSYYDNNHKMVFVTLCNWLDKWEFKKEGCELLYWAEFKYPKGDEDDFKQSANRTTNN